MKTKKYLATGMITLFTLFALTTASWAGSAHRHRMEGLAWGIGAAIVGKIILDNHRYGYAAQAPQAVVTARPYQRPAAGPSGHWEIRREWVPEQYAKVWNPGHYDRRGQWVSGHWIQVQSEPGYWREQQVWVPHY